MPGEVNKVNTLNIALMLLSCGIAYLIPLELFLFSYAVLGPLHYLTQISWLQKRGFFTRGKYDYLFLVGLCLAMLVLTIFNRGNSGFILALGFGGAVALAFSLKTKTKVIFILTVIVVALLARRLPAYTLFFGIFLPTLIHVYALHWTLHSLWRFEEPQPLGLSIVVDFCRLRVDFLCL